MRDMGFSFVLLIYSFKARDLWEFHRQPNIYQAVNFCRLILLQTLVSTIFAFFAEVGQGQV